jgi:4-amino-4-deoxy-L-arabinose transferase-like glycosyltransferase
VRRRLLPICALALAGSLYMPRLQSNPMYFGSDEAFFGLNGASIAARGRDLSGTFLPLYVNLRDPLDGANTRRWYQPIQFYLTAISLSVLPLSETAVRIPTAIVGMVDVLLMYAIGTRLFGGEKYAFAAALLLLLSPAHLIMSRQATDYICSLPFSLAWLWCVVTALQTRRSMYSVLAGALLGIGLYSYLAAWVMMPALLAITWYAQHRGHLGLRASIATTAVFTLVSLPIVIWLIAHPAMLAETIGRYQVAGTHPQAETAARLLRLDRVGAVVSTYWSYFDPSFLFLTGGTSLTTATGRTGVFLIGVGALMISGLGRRDRQHGVERTVVTAGFLAAPLAAAFVTERYMIQRAMLLVPFGTLLALFGLQSMWSNHRRRWLAAMACAAILGQFLYFTVDYFTPTRYPMRAAWYFDPADFRTLTDVAIEADTMQQAPAIYLSRRFDDGAVRWLFYVTARRHESLMDRTRYFDGDGLDLDGAPVGSLMLFYANGPSLDALVAAHRWSVVRVVEERSSGSRSMVLRKVS